MITARVGNPDMQDRFFTIEPGVCSIGSGLDCTVVLLDDGIRPIHLLLHVEEGAVAIELAEGAAAEIVAGPFGAGGALRPSERRALQVGDSLRIGDLRIDFDGAGLLLPPSRPQPPAGKSAVRTGTRLIAWSVIAALATLGFTWFSGFAEVARADAEPVASPEVSAPVEFDEAIVARRLGGLGLYPSGLVQREGRWRAVLRVAAEADLATLDAMLAGLDFPFEPTVYVDEQLRRAVELALPNFGEGLRIVSLRQGVLRLSRPVDDGRTEEAVDAGLRRDIPGLVRVDFDRKARFDPTQLRTVVSALWAGDFPYVVLTDDSIVRPGELLRPGVTLVTADAGGIVVEIEGRRERMAFP